MILTALIGHPTKHSTSPILFSLYASEFDLDYSHLKIDVTSENLKKAIFALKTLNFYGLNVTLPHKIAVIKHLDYIDINAKKIGAVNTIVNRNGKLYGYNTDSYGAMTSIKDHKSISFKKAVVLGTGGAARALISGLLENKATVNVVYRNPISTRTKSVFKDYCNKVKFFDYQDPKLINLISESTIICNATPCGMSPLSNRSPINKNILKRVSQTSNFSEKLFFDTIFNPYETQFLKDAKKLGADIQGGTEMMIYQGIKAFELWTGKQVSKNTIDKAKIVLKKQLVKSK